MPKYIRVGAGSDSANGNTYGTAYATLNHAIGAVGGVEEFLLGEGNYNEGVSYVPSGSSWSNFSRIANIPGERPVLRPTANGNGAAGTGRVVWFDYNISYVEFDGVNLDGSFLSGTGEVFWPSTNNGYNPHHIRLKNCEVIAGLIGSSAAIALGGHSLIGSPGGHEIINVTVHGGGLSGLCGFECASYGIYIAGPNNLVDGCRIYDTSGQGVQIYNAAGDPAINNIIRNCIIHDITRLGDPNQAFGILLAGSSNQAYNNVIYNISVGGGSNNAGIGTYGAVNGNKIWNNTIYSILQHGINIDSGATNTEVRNNIIYLTGNTAYNNDGTSTVESNNMRSGVNPGFVNPGAGDFRITNTSGAYHTGAYIPSISTDADGRPYSIPPSIGAYEVNEAIVGDVVTAGRNLGNNYQGTIDDDTRIRSNASDTNFGPLPAITVENYDPDTIGHTLLRFPNLPSGRTVVAATISLYVIESNGADTTIRLRRCLRAWTGSGATYNTYDGANTWGTPGALNTTTDISATVSATLAVADATSVWVTISDPQLVADFQAFINGTPNNGWMIDRSDGADDGAWRAFASSEGADGFRPYATLTLEPVEGTVGILPFMMQYAA